ncbi:MAG: DUF4914 family protein [Firmicutes bacterium]|nr:DUF4914 family protein [Bacillota bacterium]
MNRETTFPPKWRKISLPEEARGVIESAPSCLFPEDRREILRLAMGRKEEGIFEVAYEIPGKGRYVEATVALCRNGLAINYIEPYMRRRDPDCMVIGDEKPTDKPRFRDRFGTEFPPLRKETLDWLTGQELIAMPFMAGSAVNQDGHGALLIAPANAGFFVGGLGDLQGMIPWGDLPDLFVVKIVIYLAPPFRHTHFGGRQVVVHNRLDDCYEIFSYNLYPGPSAKKGVYGALLSLGVEEGWPTLHGSCVQVVTPYNNIVTILHESASGGGKSELLEYPHRQPDGRLLLGENLITGERLDLSLPRGCSLRRVCDDMAICPPEKQRPNGRLVVEDAEEGWFVRLDHIKRYGTDPFLERLTIHPPVPLIFLNLAGVPGATCLIWEHAEDAPGIPCPNPRVILPRSIMPDVVNEAVEVHYRNFGLRTPPCTRQKPSYGIAGYLHFLPPALAWLWRLVAPRGFANPSITETPALSSDGVGSYGPFLSGRYVDHANLLLRQMRSTPLVRYTLTPNQHVGAWRVSFMPEWIAREYLARRGFAPFAPGEFIPSRCELLGYTLAKFELEGSPLPEYLLRVERQPEVGIEAYDEGAEILRNFFRTELPSFLTPDLDPLGRRIIECCLDGGGLSDYEAVWAERNGKAG